MQGLGPNYPGHQQGETRRLFRDVVAARPAITIPELVRLLGVSRARVRQLAKKEGVPLNLGKAGRPPRKEKVTT